jgi:hypothetical protein
MKAEVRVLRRRDRTEVTRFKSRRRDGRFRVVLRAGQYLLDPLEGRSGPRGVYKELIPVRVRRGEFVRLKIIYDDGIR